jgi:hypothetical protein
VLPDLNSALAGLQVAQNPNKGMGSGDKNSDHDRSSPIMSKPSKNQLINKYKFDQNKYKGM